MEDKVYYIYNAVDKTVRIQAHGNWFEFKPKQIKSFHNPSIAQVIIRNGGEEGLVEFEQAMFEALLEKKPEAQEYKAKKTVEGRNNRIKKLRWLYRNETVSLQKDLDMTGLKMKPSVLSAEFPELIEAFKELRDLERAAQQQKSDAAADLENILGELNGDVVEPDPAASAEGSPRNAKPAKG